MNFIMLLLVLCNSIIAVVGNNRIDAYQKVEQFTDSCVKFPFWHQRIKPGEELGLGDACAPWRQRACCHGNITQETRFTYRDNQTGRGVFPQLCGNMSEGCWRMFIQDQCMYRCSPNLTPWLAMDKSSDGIETENAKFVPLCRTECDRWWNECKNDYTCADNYETGLNYTSDGAVCYSNMQCKTFVEYFSTAVNFCNSVFKNAFKVTPDSEPCMVLWFNETQGNPNDAVAKHKAEEILKKRKTNNGHRKLQSIIWIVLVLFITFI